MKLGIVDKMIERWGSLGHQELQSLFLRLVEQKGVFQQVFEVMKEGLIVFDHEGKVTFANKAATQILDRNLDEMRGEGFTKNILGIAWNDIAEKMSPVSQDMELTYPERRFLNFYLMPLENDSTPSASRNKTTLGCVLIIRDITHEQEKTEEQIENEQLNALALLAAGIAHEIGNPLNSLGLHLQLIHRELKNAHSETGEKCREHLHVAEIELSRLDILLKQFLQAIRPTQLHREPCSLNNLIEESLDMLSLEIQDRGITVIKDFDAHLPKLDLDTTQFKQVLFNLIKNAYQAVPVDAGNITLSTSITDKEVILTITDSGAGIPPEIMGTLFEPFRTSKQNGNGLGLLIVRRIVREHGGSLRIMSEIGIGTQITITLPTEAGRIRLLPSHS